MPKLMVAKKKNHINTAMTAASPPSPIGAKRLNPEEREEQIVRKAITYFAANGFSASTRELAREIGVTQPLLYRYFPNKEALVERVFQEVYLSRWNPDWEDWLIDRSRPLKERMYRYYKDYARIILKNEWIRIFIFAGLTREGINNRYLARIREKIFEVVLEEVRHEHGISAPNPEQHEEEIELVWSLHASIFYVGMRKWVYGLSIPKNIDRLIELKVTSFLDGTPAVMRWIRNNPQA
jgi:AcrR family transcriptional regulator